MNNDKLKREDASFKARKNYEEREARKREKHKKSKHYDVDIDDNVDLEESMYDHFTLRS